MEEKSQQQLDEQFMRLALIEARQAMDEDEIPIGAVVVCKGQVIARAHNLTERLTDVTWAQLARIVYGADDEKRGFRRYAPTALHPRTNIQDGILAEECAALMREFFQKKR